MAGTDGADTPKGTTYAWIVGISAYKNIPSLSYADSDAVLFRRFLLSNPFFNVQPVNILEMYNERATGGNLITKGLSWIEKRNYAPGDKLFIFLSGHGDAIDKDNNFFLGCDIEPGSPGEKNNYLAGTALQMVNLKDKIKKIVSLGVDVFFILDACRTNEKEKSQFKGYYSEGITEEPHGEIMMFSASPGQSALESSTVGGGHGLFTWYLVGGLAGQADKNNDGRISLFEIKRYTEEKVPNEAHNVIDGYEQIPYFCCSEKISATMSVKDSAFNAAWIAKMPVSDGSAIAMNRSRGKAQDTISTKEKPYYLLFTDAIAFGQLTGDSSASFYFKMFKKKFPSSFLVNDMKYTLVTEYLDFAQDKINYYLRGKDQVPRRIVDTLNASQHFYTTQSDLPYKEAAAMMLEAMTLIADDSVLSKKIQNKYYFLLSNSYFEANGDKSIDRRVALEKAIDTIKIAIKNDTAASYLYNTLGNLYKEKAQYDSAELAFNRAILLSPKWTYSYNNLGRTYHSQRRYDKALIQYQKAVAIDSNYAVAYNSLGNLYDDQARYMEAEKYYRKAMKHDAAFANAKENLDNLRLEKKKKGPVNKNDSKVVYHNEPLNTGQKVAVVKINDLTWMSSNLNVVCYRDGTRIKEAVTPEEWAACDSLHVGCWCYTNTTVADRVHDGKLYNWYAVNDVRGLAPAGFHIATRAEVSQLISFLGRDKAALRMRTKDNWKINGAGTNDVGWSAVGMGYRDLDGILRNSGYSAHFWCSDMSMSTAFCFYLVHNSDQVDYKYCDFGYGFSVRCVKD